METLKVGLIKGRHEMPVDKYIFEEAIKDVHNYKEINEHISNFLIENVGISTHMGSGINQHDYTDVEIFKGNKQLIIYVTGLTCVTAELIRICAMNGISLTLMNFDSVSGDYIPQPIF